VDAIPLLIFFETDPVPWNAAADVEGAYTSDGEAPKQHGM